MPALLVCQDLTFAYSRAADPVISQLTCSFEAGCMTALTGRSGCGKSTLLYLLSGMLTPSSGLVLCQGQDISALSDAHRSHLRSARMGFVFQDAMLDPSRTVLDNVLEAAVFSGIPRRAAKRRATLLLERFGVERRAGHRPGEISGGQAQRVALCRALLSQPDVVFADEPSGNLDPSSATVVFEALRQATAEGTCVVLATHDPGLAQACDEVIEL